MSLNKELQLDRPLQDIRHEAVLNIIRTASLLAQKGAGRFRQYDLTVAQFNVLFALKYKGQRISQADLSKRLVVTRASVTSVLDKLEEKGLVERQNIPDNRRAYHIELTPEGEELLDHVEPLYRKDIQEVMQGFNDAQCRVLIQALERVRRQCDNQASED